MIDTGRRPSVRPSIVEFEVRSASFSQNLFAGIRNKALIALPDFGKQASNARAAANLGY